ncbi:hypothetical protein KPL70_006891 [Citrus sinensis]|nr:hypothetical protein KPL70_006891 [Citrus sinensis]
MHQYQQDEIESSRWNIPPLRAKIEFPGFAGDDPTEWFNKVAQLFEFQRTPEDQKASLASFHLEGEANQWWQWLNRTYKEENQTVTWTMFAKELWAQFRPTDGKDFDEALSHITQSGSLRDYQREFEKLSNRVQRWTQKALVGTFMSGLKPEENEEEAESKGNREEELKVSIHALTRWSSPQTMRVAASIKSQSIVVLIDSGSTHSFLNEKVASTLRLPVVPTKSFTVRVANGERLMCQGRYEKVRVHAPDIPKTAFRTHNGHFEYLVMPFGLCNTPSTFQAIMNSIFQPYLRQFILVFFDDILVYSPTWELHLTHVRKTLEILKKHSFFVKANKCDFGKHGLEYLVHIMTNQGVKVNDKKIEAMVAWPQPTNATELRGFLGLTGYYRKFVRNYEVLARPLTNLLKKGNFKWDEDAASAFTMLKQAMTTTPTLAMPNFNEPFTIETDASGDGIGTVLTQQGRPIACMSRALGIAKCTWSIYAKEMLAIVEAIWTWRPYILATPEQQKWVAKLLGYDYEIKYQPKKENLAADALSRRPNSPLFNPIFISRVSLWDDIRKAAEMDLYMKKIFQQAANDPAGNYVVKNGLCFYKQRMVVSPALRDQLLQEFHDSKVAGHSGVLRTFTRLAQQFYWPSMHKSVQEYIQQCATCQKTKSETLAPAGLLQPLPIPCLVWVDISLDFIEGLPSSHGKDNIIVFVDRFSKSAHFIALSHPFSAKIIAESTKLKLSSAYHPQTDGQTKVVNRCLEQYLRCFVHQWPRKWYSYLPWAEYWYNTTYHCSTGMTPFQALYGRLPPSIPYYTEGLSRVNEVDQSLLTRDEVLQQLKINLELSDARMKHVADQKRREVEFQVGDLVLLKLHPYRQQFVFKRAHHKLASRFYGPFPVEQKLGKVAYRLCLPHAAQIHPVFHVSLLKKYVGTSLPAVVDLPPMSDKGQIQVVPLLIGQTWYQVY